MRRLVVAGVALALVAGACGSGTSKATDAAPKVSTVRLVSSAADVAEQQRTARISGEVGFSMGGREASVPIEGAIDFRNQAVEMTMSMSGLAGLTGGQGTDGSVEIRMVDGVMYMNMGSMLGARGEALLRGRPWVSIDVSQAGQSGTQNPADVLNTLRGAGGVEFVGHGKVGGVEADHYRAEVDLAKAVGQLPAAQRSQAQAGLQLLGPTFPVDVWIGSDGLPLRIAIDMSVKGVHLTEHIDFSDWGADLTVTAPPADQVQSLADAQGAATAGAGANAL